MPNYRIFDPGTNDSKSPDLQMLLVWQPASPSEFSIGKGYWTVYFRSAKARHWGRRLERYELPDRAYRRLLTHFGLEGREKEFRPQRMVVSSPGWLFQAGSHFEGVGCPKHGHFCKCYVTDVGGNEYTDEYTLFCSECNFKKTLVQPGGPNWESVCPFCGEERSRHQPTPPELIDHETGA